MSNFDDDFRKADAARVYGKSKSVALDVRRGQAISNFLKQRYNISSDAKSGCLLDVGCGPGIITRILAESFERSIGVDVSENLISQAQNTASPHPITFKVGAAESLPVTDSSADVITVVYALHFIQCDQFIAECKRVLKPGGIALVHGGVLSKVLLSTGPRKIIPDTTSLIKEMNDKLKVVAKDLNHPERHLLDCHETLYNDIKWPGKRRMVTTVENALSLAELRRHYMAIPFVRRLGDGDENPLIYLVESLKRLWSMEDMDEDQIEVRACYRTVTIVLSK